MGEVASQLIVFIAVITIATSVALMMSSESEKTSDAIQSQNKNMIDVIKTEIKITSINYNVIPDPDVTTIYIRNTGSTRINPRNTDVFIDGYRYGYNSRTTSIEPDTLVGSELSWDPTEVLKITISQNLTSGIHNVRVITGNGVYDEDTFSS
jgi:archaellum component FlaG (FlaF/FlaG flagellin family)